MNLGQRKQQKSPQSFDYQQPSHNYDNTYVPPQQQQQQQPAFYNPNVYQTPQTYTPQQHQEQQQQHQHHQHQHQPKQQNFNNNANNSRMFNPMDNNAHPQQNQQQQMFIPNNVQNIFNDPVASVAMKYSAQIADQGKAYVAQNVDRWFSISKLKYYFAVDTSYVAKKLFLLIFPFFSRDWSVKYNQEDNEAVPPKLDTNAPDMYIPFMAYVTYILIVGVALGTQEKFSPEHLGINASSALGWLVIEVVLILVLLQILSVKSLLKTFDIIAFCGYKYFGMILCLAASILISSTAYNIVLIYMSVSLTYFMIRSLKLLILADASPNQYQGDHSHGNKRRTYMLVFISFIQPLFMWWLTRHLA